ncbi:MAG: hypothetical protein ACTSQA_06915 [Candidatus Heimdallarchaeaceae archaeon]
MDKKIRTKQLESLANSTQGDALVDWLNEEIIKLRDGSNYDKDNFEIDGLASVKAADVLGELILDFRLFGKDKTETKKDKYN